MNDKDRELLALVAQAINSIRGWVAFIGWVILIALIFGSCNVLLSLAL